MKKGLFFVCLILLASIPCHAQSFSSSSTGADGALNLSTMNCLDNICEVQLPESGILNYTTVNIPSGKVLKFKSNSRNTPVTMLAQGAVTISGVIDVSSAGNYTCGSSIAFRLGPGGFYGGQVGQPGFGPGGGQNGESGKWVGPLSLSPIVGGSGGAGACYGFYCWGGGPGGGAIVIASSSSITSNGQLLANGSSHGNCASGGSSGSGGAIRLVANSLNVTGQLQACGGSNCGVIRLEAPSGSLTFTGSSNPPAGLFPINPTIVPTAAPSLTIVSIAGYPVPSYAGSRFDTYDLLLPNQLTDPINVVVRGNNIPVGTKVNIGFVNGSPQATSTPGTLSGTLASSSATLTIAGLNRTAVTYLLASATFNPPANLAAYNPKGPDQVAKVRVEAAPGVRPKFVFLRGNGTVIELARIPNEFLKQFGH